MTRPIDYLASVPDRPDERVYCDACHGTGRDRYPRDEADDRCECCAGRGWWYADDEQDTQDAGRAQ